MNQTTFHSLYHKLFIDQISGIRENNKKSIELRNELYRIAQKLEEGLNKQLNNHLLDFLYFRLSSPYHRKNISQVLNNKFETWIKLEKENKINYSCNKQKLKQLFDNYIYFPNPDLKLFLENLNNLLNNDISLLDRGKTYFLKEKDKIKRLWIYHSKRKEKKLVPIVEVNNWLNNGWHKRTVRNHSNTISNKFNRSLWDELHIQSFDIINLQDKWRLYSVDRYGKLNKISEGYGRWRESLILNASLLDRLYDNLYQPLYYDYEIISLNLKENIDERWKFLNQNDRNCYKNWEKFSSMKWLPNYRYAK